MCPLEIINLPNPLMQLSVGVELSPNLTLGMWWEGAGRPKLLLSLWRQSGFCCTWAAWAGGWIESESTLGWFSVFVNASWVLALPFCLVFRRWALESSNPPVSLSEKILVQVSMNFPRQFDRPLVWVEKLALTRGIHEAWSILVPGAGRGFG